MEYNEELGLVTHEANKCAGHYCCIHNPSNHFMQDWPLNWRSDTQVMERICSHGCGHPDPDSMAYEISIGNAYKGIHGCCGCCVQPIEISGEVVKNLIEKF